MYKKEYVDGQKQYPELDELARNIAQEIGRMINGSAFQIKSEMPYKSQYVLEEVIRHLEAAV